MSELTPKNIFKSNLLWPILGFAFLLLFNAVFNPSFFSISLVDGNLYGNLIDVFRNGSITMILALGMCLVIATGGIDLSVGTTMAITGAVVAIVYQNNPDTSLAIALAVSLGVAGIAGLLNGALVAFARIQPIIATLILMVAGRGIANFITGEKQITVTNEAFGYIGGGHLFTLPFSIVLVFLLYGLLVLATRKTPGALFIEVTGDNEEAARFSGVSTRWIKLTVYLVCGLCAGLAGLVETSNLANADPSQLGIYKELDAIFAVVVGGTALSGGRFSLIGALIGALLLQTLTTTLYSFGVDSALSPIPKSLLIIAVYLLRSDRFRRQLTGWIPVKHAAA